jgi:hypothetical protein
MGTIDYVAPEQLDGGPISARTDIYSMSCLLFEALTGRVPFEGPITRKLYAHGHEPLPSVGGAVGGHGAAVDAVLERGAAKVPDARYQSAGDLSRAFSAALRDVAEPAAESTVAAGTGLAGSPTLTMSPVSVTSDADETAVDRRPPRVAVGAHRQAPRPPPPERSGRRRNLTLGALLLGAIVVGAAVFATLLVHSGSGQRNSGGGLAASSRGGIVKVKVITPAPGSIVTPGRVTVEGTVGLRTPPFTSTETWPA